MLQHPPQRAAQHAAPRGPGPGPRLTAAARARSSVMFYLVDPRGRFVNYYGANLNPREIADKIATEMKTPLADR